MSGLSNLKLKNFRSFPADEWTEVDLSLFSILTGPNNSGKSSVIKAILLLTENLNSASFDTLDFTSGQHGLDSFDYTVNANAKDKFMSFAFDILHFSYPDNLFEGSSYGQGYMEEFFLQRPSVLTVELHYSNKGDGNGELRIFRILIDEILLFELYKDINNKHSMFINFTWLVKNGKSGFIPGLAKKFDDMKVPLPDSVNEAVTNRVLDYVSHLSMDRLTWGEDDRTYYGNYDETPLFNISNKLIPFGTDYRKIAETTILSLFEPEEYESFDSLSQVLKDVRVGEIIQDRENIYIHFEDLIRNWQRAFVGSIDSEYIPQARAHPSRLFTLNGNEPLVRLLKRTSSAVLSQEKQNFLDKYIQVFNIGDTVRLSRVKNTFEVVVKRGNKDIDLIDLGASSLWILPILLGIVLIDQERISNKDEINRFVRKNRLILSDDGFIGIKNWSNDYDTEYEDLIDFKGRWFKKNLIYEYKTVIVEEPEMCLHPNLQSQLALMFVDASNMFNIQFLIETHSEYFIRKLQALLASNMVHSADFSMYYFTENQKLTKIKVERLGNLKTEFGAGFFDESTTLKDELASAQEKQILEERLASFRYDYSTEIKCLILTEDSKDIEKPEKTNIFKILKASNFVMEQVRIHTYSTSSQIQIALGIAEQAEKLPHIKKIIIHRDSDGEKVKRENELSRFIKNRKLKKTVSFVTSYNDLEGYFINVRHIHALYPEISLNKIERVISKASEESKESSIKSLSKRLGDNEDIARRVFELNPEAYRHSKKMKSAINRALSSLGKSLNILEYSDYLKVQELEKISANIWDSKHPLEFNSTEYT